MVQPKISASKNYVTSQHHNSKTWKKCIKPRLSTIELSHLVFANNPDCVLRNLLWEINSAIQPVCPLKASLKYCPHSQQCPCRLCLQGMLHWSYPLLLEGILHGVWTLPSRRLEWNGGNTASCFLSVFLYTWSILFPKERLSCLISDLFCGDQMTLWQKLQMPRSRCGLGLPGLHGVLVCLSPCSPTTGYEDCSMS